MTILPPSRRPEPFGTSTPITGHVKDGLTRTTRKRIISREAKKKLYKSEQRGRFEVRRDRMPKEEDENIHNVTLYESTTTCF